jgi:mono/diheme cytochrome c family protein
MKLISLSLLVVVLCLVGVGCTQPAEQPATPKVTPAPAAATPDQFATERAIFAKDCINCHMAKGEGGRVTIDDKKLKVPSLREGHALDHPDSEFLEQIQKGGDGMPAFKDKLKPEEMSALVRFIRHEFQGDRPSPPEPAKAGSPH